MKKKIIAIILTIAFIFTTTGCNKLTTYEELTYDDLMNKIEQKEDFVLMIGSSECNHCLTFKKTLDKVIEKYQVKIYYINVHDLSDEEDKELRNQFYYTGTPTTVFVKKGKETSMNDRIDGNKPYKTVVEKLKKQGYIK